jgi:hypothetical protein
MGPVRVAVLLVAAVTGVLFVDAHPAGAGAPFQVVSQGSLIVGRAGTTLKVVVTPEAGGGPVARSCYDINDNIFAVSATDMTEPPGSGDICSGATNVAQIPAGTYRLTAGIYEPAGQTPLREVHLDFTAGDFPFVTINGAALSKEALGDANCDGILGGPDLVAILSAASGTGSHPCAESGNLICGDPLGPQDALALAMHLSGIAPSLGACSSILAAPPLVSPADGAEFDIFPRTTVLDWESVPGATGYVVYVDRYGCEPYTDWCSAFGWGYLSQHTNDTTWQFDFVGSGSGRWRVAAVGSDGRAGPFSEWRGFMYLH